MRRSTIGGLILAGLVTGKPQGPFPVELDAGGCRIERVTSGRDTSYHQFHGLSPDGRRLVVGWETLGPDHPARGAFLVELQSGAHGELPALNNAASFSPDGAALVSGFQTGSPGLRTEIVEYDLGTHQLKFLAPDPLGDWLPTYSADGGAIVFNSFRTGGSDLYRLDRSSGNLERLTDDPRYEAHAQLSRDGRRIVFHRQVEGADYAVEILDLATRQIRAIANTPAEEAYPAWSPEADRIVFSSDRGRAPGDADLYIADTAGRVRRQLTATPGKDTYADWSPDGRFIYFNSGRGRRQGTDVFRIAMRGDDCRR